MIDEVLRSWSGRAVECGGPPGGCTLGRIVPAEQADAAKEAVSPWPES